MKCSSLNSHLYRKNPTCSYVGFESSYHFFFTCPKYSRIRNSYLPHNLHTCNTEHLLHGRDDLSDTENEQLFLHVRVFILQTKRFTQFAINVPRHQKKIKKKKKKKSCCTYLYHPVFVAVFGEFWSTSSHLSFDSKIVFIMIAYKTLQII